MLKQKQTRKKRLPKNTVSEVRCCVSFTAIFELDMCVLCKHMPICCSCSCTYAQVTLRLELLSVHTHKEYITSNIITGIVRLAFSIWHVMHPCGCWNFTSFSEFACDTTVIVEFKQQSNILCIKQQQHQRQQYREETAIKWKYKHLLGTFSESNLK